MRTLSVGLCLVYTCKTGWSVNCDYCPGCLDWSCSLKTLVISTESQPPCGMSPPNLESPVRVSATGCSFTTCLFLALQHCGTLGSSAEPEACSWCGCGPVVGSLCCKELCRSILGRKLICPITGKEGVDQVPVWTLLRYWCCDCHSDMMWYAVTCDMLCMSETCSSCHFQHPWILFDAPLVPPSSMRSEVSKAHEPRDGFHPGTRWLSQDTESCYIHLLSSISIQWPSQDG